MPWKVEHRSQGEVCALCFRPSRAHFPRDRKEYQRAYKRSPEPLAQDNIIGIDGEGIGRAPHRYVYLAAHDEKERSWSVEALPSKFDNQTRLATEQCLDFILALPQRTLIVGFAFNYDLTKILQDLPDKALYLLFREKLRMRRTEEGDIVYRPITWRGYRLNYMNRRFTVGKLGWKQTRNGRKWGTVRSATVWDIFAFFQTKFTTALIDWQVAEKAKLERMAAMKDKRAVFDQLSLKEIHAYCKEECAYLAKLARQLIEAHKGAGIKLKTYFGAGSTASALLKSWDISSKRGLTPDAMRKPVACAFFGGRFETSIVGPIARTIHEYDISSAYPYQATLLPCLLHGHWRHVRGSQCDGAIAGGSLSLVRWHATKPYGSAWGPLPIRSIDGTIAFPLGAASGWTWKAEWLAACKLHPYLVATEAWVYETDCACKPFSELPKVYLERCKLGSDTRGIPLKLGPNSVYGKLAQSRGFNPPFQQWVWAGNITSGTRAQLLEAIYASKDPWSILSLATDGVQSLEPLSLPKPVDTGTSEASKGALGDWTYKKYVDGVFYVRPGIYFPIKPTDDEIKIVRARGIGKKVLYDQRERVIEAWRNGGSVVEGAFRPDVVSFQAVNRFVGAKSGVTIGKVSGVKRSPRYGDWIEHQIVVSFDARPKRQRKRLPGNRLAPHKYLDWASVPYKHANVSPEAMEQFISRLMTEEQPNLDFETTEAA